MLSPVKGTDFENAHTNQGERNPRALGRQPPARHAKSFGERSGNSPVLALRVIGEP
jgi:hypothetical protein